MVDVRRKVVPLTYPESIGIGYVRLECLPGFGERDGFDPRDPDDAEALAWLDANAPGWTRHARPYGGPVEVSMPVGRDEVLTMVEYERFLVFAAPEHRVAWRRRRAAMTAERVRVRAAYDLAVASHGPDAEVCTECAVLMTPFRGVERDRIGQFAFDVACEGHECACGMRSHSMADSAGYVGAMDAIAERAGLPKHGSPLYDDSVREEWRRRREAPPDLVLAVAKGETSESVLARLDAALAEAGVPARGTRPRLA